MTPMDRVLKVEPGQCASAVRHLPSTLDVFTTHFPRFPVQPGVLLLDDMVTVARLALGSAERSWVLSQACRVRFRRFARPGDTVEIDAEVVSHDGDTATCRTTARVDGETVATVRALILVATEGATACGG